MYLVNLGYHEEDGGQILERKDVGLPLHRQQREIRFQFYQIIQNLEEEEKVLKAEEVEGEEEEVEARIEAEEEVEEEVEAEEQLWYVDERPNSTCSNGFSLPSMDALRYVF